MILYSTSAYNGQVKFHDPFHYLKKQGFATLLGLFGMALIARVDYHKWVPLAIPAYVTSIILSVAVIFFGDEYNGSKRWLSLGCFRCLPIERIFSKAEIWSQELQFNYKFLTNATKQAFSMPTKCRASFSRPLSTLGTANVAKFRPPSVAPWVNVILIKQLLQLYFPKTFQRISFSGYFLAVFDGS